MDPQPASTPPIPGKKFNPLIGLVVVLVLIGAALLLSKKSTPPQTAPEGAKTETTITQAASPSEAMKASEQAKEFTVDGSNFKFDPNKLSVKQGDKVRITFKNTQGMHNFKIDEFNAATKVIKTGETETIEFVADKKGSFEYYCSVGQHRANGMVGTLTVE